MRSCTWAVVIVGLILVIVSMTPGTSTSMATPVVSDAVEMERAANLAAYEKSYLPSKERLFGRFAGAWVVITGGEVFPKKKDGDILPAKELEAALAAAEEAHPSTAHRFVFRVGEDGDLSYQPSLCDKPSYVGSQFLYYLRPKVLFSGDGIYVGPEGARLVDPTSPEAKNAPRGDFKRIGPGSDSPGGPAITPVVSAPMGKNASALELAVATGYSGLTILGADDAQVRGLERWEIPGTIDTVIAKLRRARAHFRLVEAQLDEMIPVGVRYP